MHRFTETRLLPHAAESVYAVVTDIERYPQFVPHWLAARILRRDGDRLDVEQTIRFGPLPVTFRSRALFTPVTSAAIESSEGPFRHFRIHWGFAAESTVSCRVQFSLEFELRALLLNRAAGSMAEPISRDVIAAFEKRLAARPTPHA
jgi:coenzyme Q-binding protein COQ10